jgi:DNA-binding CsgD family transcriptional regulator
VRIYKDRSQFLLGSNENWIEHYIKNQCFNSDMALNLENFKPGGYLWKGLHGDKRFKIQRESFNIDNGIILINERPEYKEFINFATTRDDIRANNFYLHNMDAIQLFVEYFKEKSESLIKSISQKKIIVPEVKIIDKFDNPELVYNIQNRKNFFSQILKKSSTLTTKEASCLLHIANGLSAKEIGKLMNISYRTVEIHIANIKVKLGCKSKQEIIKKFYNNSFYNLNLQHLS